ncbi:hypothetical protein D9756_008139 [Leucocoprinus leucothites]|uniref:Uncharacterized protein n=1 Tax=Leucocoprinus leucothites TaxID=201217 RepID=A0A8H5D511_9AGAR|nr:hypothetical protein D9756_008139 [Leucoagaricus leucothites]
MVRFIQDENSYGPQDQLRIVVDFAKDVSAKVEVGNPLAEMDFFYTLIIQRIPLKLRATLRKILLFRHTCASIQSVMELQGSDLDHMDINFYHASFLEFMRDPQRSKELCIHGDLLIGLRRELLAWLHESTVSLADSSHIVFPSDTILPEGRSHTSHYFYVLICFWELCKLLVHQLDPQTAMSLAELPFNKMLGLVDNGFRRPINALLIRNNLPANLRDKVIRKGKCLIPGCTNTEEVWILGHGENESVPRQSGNVFAKLNTERQESNIGDIDEDDSHSTIFLS